MTTLHMLSIYLALLFFFFPQTFAAKPAVRLFEDDFLPEGTACKRGGPFDYPRCHPGFWCLRGICARRGILGDTCADTSECGEELRCSENGICKPDPLPAGFYKRMGEPCKRNAFQRCTPGLWCIAGFCRRLVPCGGRCDDMVRVCRPGLECATLFESGGLRLCRQISGSLKVIQFGDVCAPNVAGRCRTGLRCVVRGDRGTCRPPERIGQRCGGERSDCESGRICRGDDGSKRCVQLMLENERCDFQLLVCATGFMCVNERCSPGRYMRTGYE